MRRPYLGIGILLALLLLGAVIWWGMEMIHNDIEDLLTQAQQAAQKEEWEKAEDAIQRAYHRWEQYHHFTASFADHTPMDELDGLFAELLVYLDQRESPHFEATCARLILLTQAMAESHGITWWNIL